MKNDRTICVHELDFLLPVHRFQIGFTYTSDQRLSFIREFILRVVNVSSLKPSDIGQFFALSKRELDEALSDLVGSGDLHYRDNGYVKLTNLAKGYFSNRIESIPKVQGLKDASGYFNFELSSMNYLGSKQANENWKFGIKLSIDNERKARSELLAKKAFQYEFQNILDAGDVTGVTDSGEDTKLNLYNVSEVRKVSEQPFRISHSFSVTPDGEMLERGDIEVLKDASEAVELITDAIERYRQPQNALEIFQAMDIFKDDQGKTYLTDDGLDIKEILLDRKRLESKGEKTVTSHNLRANQSSSLQEPSESAGKAAGEAFLPEKNEKLQKTVPFLGAIYTPDNWLPVAKTLEDNGKKNAKKHTEGVPELVWLTPANPFWGKSDKVFSCLKYVEEKSKSTSQKTKRLYQPQIFLPVPEDSHRRGQLLREFEGLGSKNLHGYTGEFLKGNIEVLVHSELFAAVCYHLTAPDISLVPIPFGFITHDKNHVKHIYNIVQQFCSDTK